MDDLVEQLYDTTWISHVYNQAQRDKAAREIIRLREQVAQWEKLHAENCVAFDKAVAEREWFRDRAVDPAAILAEHTRLTNLTPPDRKIGKRGTVADSDGDDGA